MLTLRKRVSMYVPRFCLVCGCIFVLLAGVYVVVFVLHDASSHRLFPFFSPQLQAFGPFWMSYNIGEPGSAVFSCSEVHVCNDTQGWSASDIVDRENKDRPVLHKHVPSKTHLALLQHKKGRAASKGSSAHHDIASHIRQAQHQAQGQQLFSSHASHPPRELDFSTQNLLPDPALGGGAF